MDAPTDADAAVAKKCGTNIGQERFGRNERSLVRGLRLTGHAWVAVCLAEFEIWWIFRSLRRRVEADGLAASKTAGQPISGA
jgi:hypothetical protein